MGNKTFTFGIDSDPIAPGEFGSPVSYTDALYQASLGKPSVDAKPYEDAWGRFYSAYSPVFDSQGKVAGVVTVDFEAAWYEGQLNMNARTIILACVLFLIVGIGLVLFLTREFVSRIGRINSNLNDLALSMDGLTGNQTGRAALSSRPTLGGESITMMEDTIVSLRNDLRVYTGHIDTQAKSMINAMASDYRCVYYVDLDRNVGVCYRADPTDKEQTPEGVYFSFLYRFTWYADHMVTESYREGFILLSG